MNINKNTQPKPPFFISGFVSAVLMGVCDEEHSISNNSLVLVIASQRLADTVFRVADAYKHFLLVWDIPNERGASPFNLMVETSAGGQQSQVFNTNLGVFQICPAAGFQGNLTVEAVSLTDAHCTCQ